VIDEIEQAPDVEWRRRVQLLTRKATVSLVREPGALVERKACRRDNGMIDIPSATPEQIRRAGLEVLARELGSVGMIRFLQQFDPGAG
jgi:hypothetical protein